MESRRLAGALRIQSEASTATAVLQAAQVPFRFDAQMALAPLVEMNERIWEALSGSLQDLSDEEIDWRPLPQANFVRQCS